MSKSALSEWRPRLVVPKNVVTAGIFLLIALFYVDYRWPHIFAVRDLSGSLCTCPPAEWQDTLAVALVEWKDQNSTDLTTDTCLESLEQAHIKRLFVALQQMVKEDVCSRQNGRYTKTALDRIFGRAFPNGISNL